MSFNLAADDEDDEDVMADTAPAGESNDAQEIRNKIAAPQCPHGMRGRTNPGGDPYRITIMQESRS